MSRRRNQEEELRCSFCLKSQDSVFKLISSPTDTPFRAFICDECVTVCASILADDRAPREASEPVESDYFATLFNRSLTAELLATIERWVRDESSGADAATDFDEVRAVAKRWVASGHSE